MCVELSEKNRFLRNLINFFDINNFQFNVTATFIFNMQQQQYGQQI